MEDSFAAKVGSWDEDPAKVKQAENFAKYLVQHVVLQPSANGVEFGCGTGLVGLRLASSFLQLTMIDTSPSMLEQLAEKVRVSKIPNVTTLLGELADYKGEPVDAVAGFMVLHHIEHTDEVFSTVYQILKEGGVLAIGDLVKEDGSFHPSETVPHNGFDMEELSQIAKRNGFTDILIQEYDRRSKNGREYPLFFMLAYK